MSHPTHPRCPKCSKPLFKRIDSGKVKKTDPYAYCRNAACELFHGREPGRVRTIGLADVGWASDVAPTPAPAKASGRARGRTVQAAAEIVKSAAAAMETKSGVETPKLVDSPPASRSGKRLPRKAIPLADKTPPTMPMQAVDAVEKVRRRIKEILAKFTGDGAPREAIGLALAIANQETGSHAAANALIDEFDLGRFGIQKVDSSTKPAEAQTT